MKKLLILILACPAILLAQPVQIGEFKHGGKIYRNAQASLISSNEIAIRSDSGSVTINWQDANASIQFKLRGQREKMIKDDAANQIKESEIQKRIESGERRIDGYVTKVLPNGCLISAQIPAIPNYRIPADSLTRVGGSWGSTTKQPREMASIPYVDGTLFVEGLKGYSDGQSVHITANMTERFIEIE